MQLRQQGRSVAWFARQLHCDRTTCYRIFRQHSIDTVLLLRISKILGHDFFEAYRVHLQEACDTNATDV